MFRGTAGRLLLDISASLLSTEEASSLQCPQASIGSAGDGRLQHERDTQMQHLNSKTEVQRAARAGVYFLNAGALLGRSN
jgi:hypothetical protein